ncbi:hypothetical protein [Clostridium sp. 'White wine YQ']|uniref:hypothetical protein n=1 Tax=Clostridium sp. 'White wine YQ' TaxID=3027474 RepID=UPI002366B466|nr:hypothetical protein [Clostridium sp. 'White wine YQ']MDD7792797.1 hypothetical protein [Clostridium sp. 'White wine YQ']
MYFNYPEEYFLPVIREEIIDIEDGIISNGAREINTKTNIYCDIDEEYVDNFLKSYTL